MRRAHRMQVPWVGGAVLFGLALSLARFATDPIRTSPDSYEYMRGGVTIWSGEGFRSMSGGDQVLFPPFYPLAIGAANALLDDPLIAARIVSLASSVISILLFYLVARLLSPGMPAIFATWLYAILPLRISLSSMAWSESLFVVLVLAAVLLWEAAGTRLARALACGVVLGAAYLTRPEGFLVFVILLVGVAAGSAAATRRLSATLRRLAPLVIGFVVVASPYILYLRAHTGRWQLTGKAKANLSIATQRTADVPFERLRRLSDSDRQGAESEQGTELSSVAARTVKNTRTVLRMLGESLGPFLFIAIGVGAVGAWWRRPGTASITRLLALASPSLIVPFFFVQERMLIMASITAVLLAAPSVMCGATAAAEPSGQSARRLAVFLLVSTAAWMAASSPIRERATPDGRPGRAELLTALRREHGVSGALLGNGKISRELAFATGRDHIFLPWEPLGRVLHYARSRHASHLLVQSTDHPGLAAIARQPIKTSDLSPIAHSQASSDRRQGVLRLYRIGGPSRPEEETLPPRAE